LTNEPILRITYLEKDFMVCMDAHKEGIGGVLIHEGQVVCHESQNLNEHE